MKLFSYFSFNQFAMDTIAARTAHRYVVQMLSLSVSVLSYA